MDYNEFVKKLVDELAKLFGDDVEIVRKAIPKNNIPGKDAILLKAKHIGSCATPTFYLEEYYGSFLEGEPIKEIVKDIAESYRRNAVDIDLSFFQTYEKVRNNIFCMVVNKEKNEEFLKTVPHRTFLDLAIVPYYKYIGKLGLGLIKIYKLHLDDWGISADELLDQAERNTRKEKVEYIEMRSLLEKYCPVDEVQFRIVEQGDLDEVQSEIEQKGSLAYVLTNKESYLGAIYLTYDSVLTEIGDRLGCDYFVLPSSVHECIIVPWDAALREEDLDRMVKEINQTEVKPEDVLADHAYLYQRSLHKLSIVEVKQAA